MLLSSLPPWLHSTCPNPSPSPASATCHRIRHPPFRKAKLLAPLTDRPLQLPPLTAKCTHHLPIGNATRAHLPCPLPDLYFPCHGQLAAHDDLFSTRTRRPSQLAAMPDTESDHHHGDDAAVARLDLVATPTAPATTTTSATGTATARDEDEEDGFTFAAVDVVIIPRLQDADDFAFPDAWIGSPVYPVFGRPRRSLSLPKHAQQQEQDEIEEDDEVEEESSTVAEPGTATVRRVPLERLLLEEECAPSAAELDGVPEETYCLWSPGVSSPASAGSSRRAASPARCRKSRSTGSSVLRWRRRSHIDHSKDDKFVSLGTSSEFIGAGDRQGWINRGSPARDGGGKSSSTAFLQCKQDLVGLVTNAVTCGRSCYLF